MHRQPFTRREFLKLGAGAGLGVALGGLAALPGCAPAAPSPFDFTADPAGNLTPATVKAVLGMDLRAMTRQALDAIGGIGTIVQPGQTVFIKPNLLTAGTVHSNPCATGECTKPEIVVEVAEACLKAGAARVTIGDGAQVPTFAWEELTTLDGTTHMAAEAARLNAAYDNRLVLACLNSESPEWDALPGPQSGLGEVYASSLVTRADRIISLPVLKTHHVARVTLSMKNFVGTAPLARYQDFAGATQRSKLHVAPGGVEGAVVDLVAAVRPDLAIVDGSVGVEGLGPWVRAGGGRTVDLRERLGQWVLLASTDLVAADTTAARMIGQDPAAVTHLRKGYELGLGQAREDLITLSGASLDELRVEWNLV